MPPNDAALSTCDSCGEEYERAALSPDGYGDFYCVDCFDPDAEPESNYDYDEDDDPYTPASEQETDDEEIEWTANDLGFEPRYFKPDRGDQLTSVELEFGKAPEGLADLLYQRGLSTTDSVGGYHGNARRNRGTAYVEYDGSVSGGGELVISMVRLPEENETLRLWHTVKALRDRVHSGDNRLDMRCGCHIHVNALGRTLDSVISTVVAYNHIEDILYRLAAANYKHHRLDNGNSYASRTNKQWADKERFRASFGGQRYYGLNVGNYLDYRHNCNCGVGFENADRCRCDVSRFYKPTLEFRLFNTTANSKKLHAFIALCQALVAYGTNRQLQATDLPPMEYQSSEYFPLSNQEYAERVAWMLRELPLSADERNSIRYCLRNCDIAEHLNKGVTEGVADAQLVQAVLHEDELLGVEDYIIPSRPEEAPGQLHISEVPVVDEVEFWRDAALEFGQPTPERHQLRRSFALDPYRGCGHIDCTVCREFVDIERNSAGRWVWFDTRRFVSNEFVQARNEEIPGNRAAADFNARIINSLSIS